MSNPELNDPSVPYPDDFTPPSKAEPETFIKYRIIKYEFPTEEGLEHQLNNSLSNGVHLVGKGGKMTIRSKNEDPCEPGFMDDSRLVRHTNFPKIGGTQ